MRHQVDGRKFGRNTSHRVAMLRNMANAVIAQEQIVTTVAKAKEVRRVVDRLVTLAKRGKPHARRLAFDRTRDKDVVAKLFDSLVERYKSRAGGYTRVLKMADRRWGDAAEMAVLELVDHPELDRKKKVKAQPAKAEGAAEGEAAAQTTKDPFSRVRRLFGSGGDKSKVKAPRAGKGAGLKGGAARKTPAAGGGSNKSGGSSS